MSEQLRDKLRDLSKPTKTDFRYPIEAYEDDLVQLIDQHTKEQITNVLDRLDNAVFSDGFPQMVLTKVMESIAEERKKLL